MQILKSLRLAVPALSAVAALALSGAAANAQEVAGLDVQGHAPTTLRINISGKDSLAVAKAVHVAAHTVCNNAIANRELDLGDFIACQDPSFGEAMKPYAAMRTSHNVASIAGAIVLSAR
jgi:hypothetical protein